MPALVEIIRTHHAEILDRWTEEARRTAAARGLDRPEFQNLIPEYLHLLGEAGDTLGRFQGERRQEVEKHLSSRLRQGFQLAEIVEEFAILGRSIADTWAPGRAVEPPGRVEVEALFAELHLTSVAVTEMFVRHMMEDEQAEKQFIRLIQEVASAALEPDAPRLEERFRDVLTLVVEAIGAQSAALLLYNAQSGELELRASLGPGGHAMTHDTVGLEPSKLAEQIAASDEPSSLWHAVAAGLTVSEPLRRRGVESLVGVWLAARHRLLGIICVGSTDRRAFSEREVRRLEVLGHHVTTHLDNARLYGELREHIDRLHAERELRDRFVSILAHDLRGPLSAAKITAQLLIRHPERLDQRRELAVKIDSNLERIDRMIRDLLDANRVRAGGTLPLRIDACDLAAVAREVFEELVATFGERFALKVDDGVVGFWSADELRRALWNLATNAVKYGQIDRPITIHVERTAEGGRAAVHNWGAPISPEDQQLLFRPFSRTRAAETGGERGWGLGLTLVQGCAMAHGGRVTVESDARRGTTFALELPLDARPFQARADEATSDHEWGAAASWRARSRA